LNEDINKRERDHNKENNENSRNMSNISILDKEDNDSDKKSSKYKTTYSNDLKNNSKKGISKVNNSIYDKNNLTMTGLDKNKK